MAKKNWKREFADLVEDSWSYLSEQRRYIYAVALIFLVSAAIGFALSDRLSFFDQVLSGIIDETRDLDYVELIWFIFSNNLTSALSALFLGVILGIFPLMNAIFNGTLLGYVYSKAAAVGGYGVIWRLFPHGIFELPAVFISLGLGMHLGVSWFSKDWRSTLKYRASKCLIVFLTIVLPVLALAAIIESTLIVFSG